MAMTPQQELPPPLGPLAPPSCGASTRTEPSKGPVKTTGKETTNPWETCLEYANKFTEEEIAIWKDEVDKLLIFAGLFSGVVASFAVEAYHNVKEDPADKTALLLRELLALQLNATNPQGTFAGVELDPKSPPSASARRIIIYHFLSLFLSLSTAMAGIICLQWIREYGRSLSGIPGPRRAHLGIHFMRHRGLEQWHVFNILTTLPVLLLLSLVLFFIGIIELLLDVDGRAGIAALVMAGITFFFMLITTLLPSLLPCARLAQCPYKSPQAWICYQLFHTLAQLPTWIRSRFSNQARPEDREVSIRFWSWSDYDWRAYQELASEKCQAAGIGQGLHWLGAMFLQYRKFAEALHQCVKDDGDEDVQLSLRHILKEVDKRRWKSCEEALKNDPSDDKTSDEPASTAGEEFHAHVQDVVVTQTLGHLAEKIERGHPSAILLSQRLDLFLKINGGTHPYADVDVPLMSDAQLKDLIPREKRIKLLRCITRMFEMDIRCHDTHLAVVKGILRLESQERHPEALQIFTDAMESLQNWNDERKLGLRNYMSVLKRLIFSLP